MVAPWDAFDSSANNHSLSAPWPDQISSCSFTSPSAGRTPLVVERVREALAQQRLAMREMALSCDRYRLPRQPSLDTWQR